MLLSALAFLAGTCLLLFSPSLPNPVWQIALVVATVPMIRICLLRNAALIALGYCWAAWQAGGLLDRQLPADLQGRDILIQGIVESLPEKMSGGQTRFYFTVTAFRSSQGWRSLRLPTRLHWYRGILPMQSGEEWRLRVRLKKPHGFSNPGSFDYERWLFSMGIRATGYVKQGSGNQRIAGPTGYYTDRIRQRITEHLDSLDLPAANIALLRALTVGDRAGITLSQWQVLQSTGTSHLLAISGLHVGLVATLVFAFSRRVWSMSGAVRWWPAPRFAALAAMLAALGYALLAGFQIPAQRALIMVWVWMLATVLNGRADPWLVLGIALWLVVLIDPFVGLSAGFWLSFGAVALIFYIGGGRYGATGRLKRVLVLQAGLVVGLTPLTWFWFQQASWVSIPANLLAIPWVGMLIVPLLLLAVVLLPWFAELSNGMIHITAWLLDWLWVWLGWLSEFPGVLLMAPAGHAVLLVVFAVGLLILLLPAAFRAGLPALILIIPVFLDTPERPVDGDLWVNLLDVGQGLSVVLETRQHVLVYDTGPAFRSGFDTGAGVVAPFLRTRGLQAIDRLVVSHGDNDHRGGVVSLLRQIPASSIHSGDPAVLENPAAEHCQSGQNWQWDHVKFEYLSPSRPAPGNNGSCVLRVTPSDGRSILLTGDIEKPVERELVATAGMTLSADVLVAPHHGSLSSSTRAFIDRVNPRLVLFAVGYRNRFGFPRREVTERYRRVGAELMNTADHGAVSIRFESGKPLESGSWRAESRRLWHSMERQ